MSTYIQLNANNFLNNNFIFNPIAPLELSAVSSIHLCINVKRIEKIHCFIIQKPIATHVRDHFQVLKNGFGTHS